ncbi:PilC/PilY family type IV pilus protein [Pseudomonas sp. TUM22785]|uniref:PilC/PilY family type IV pilus protein n=1 Tax=Pseudomonas sp. TUM22785 TaxID=3019098 RepID=UPI002305F6C0|nr:PilC/PilY family type IV pilus protein [Pseudomonas sp. TUM22785]WCD81512.1 PilC/PilY family type IV pilus protein [Pseudomonas sp. TUM22785]
MKRTRKPLLFAGAFFYTLFSLQSALAEDIEIYVTRDLPADQRVRPNILFIIDSSGSMDTKVKSTNKTRIQVVQSVTNNLIDQLKGNGDVNIGFMRFNTSGGGKVISPISILNNSTADGFKQTVNNIGADDWTPLLETYYEAYLYLTGGTPVWGKKTSVASSMANGKYISPITHSCQKTSIIYLTDGEPTEDVDSNADVRKLVAGKNTAPWASTSCGNGHGVCLPHLAQFLANQDLSSSYSGKQIASTYTIGFATDQTLLSNTAAAGKGSYQTTDNVSGLTEAMKSIIVEILAENTTFATPSVAVSAYNNLGFRNDLYYALFRPAEGARWVGNVKRYKLGKNSTGDSIILDASGAAAVDSTTGFFSETSRSFWSTAADGRDVEKGGVAARLPAPTSRSVFTWTAADRSPTASAGVTDSAALPTFSDTTALTSALLGASSTAERTKFIEWGRGFDPDSTTSPKTARKQVGDVLHNEPKLVAYKTDEDLVRVANSQKPTSDATYEASPEQLYMFFGTNEGFIHAVDPSTGEEKFAFIPKELLPNLGYYYKNAEGLGTKKYGMDGQFNLWTEYSDLNASTRTRDITKAYLYAGMGRGGRNYYALDVTSITAPKLKWTIKGGETSGFEKLGQSWSTPKLAKIKLNGTDKQVLIFTGGYDVNQDNDNPNTPIDDTIGNRIFIVDADTGQLLWSAGNTGSTLNITSMTNSIPADPAIIDRNGDGFADIIYAADTRGQVFRVDLNNANTGASTLATGGRIASFGGTNALNNRRFFNTPDVALVRERGGRSYFTISLGSGYRAHPLNENTVDRFYVIRDTSVSAPPTAYTTLTESDLTDVSSINLTEAGAAEILASIATKEAAINSLNNAASAAQTNFKNYKAGINFTSKQTEMVDTATEANNRQKQIDAIFDADPYIAEHAPESTKQSAYQTQIGAMQSLLNELVQGNVDTSERARLVAAYNSVLATQSTLDSLNSQILAKEQQIIAAQVDPQPGVVQGLEAELATLRSNYTANAAYTKREQQNQSDRLKQLITAVKESQSSPPPALHDAITNLLAETGTGTGQDEAALQARDEATKQAQLSNQATNQTNNTTLINTLEAQRVTLAGKVSSLQAELDALAATPYSNSPTLTNAQLTAARAKYGNGMTIFDAYQYLIDVALTNASDQLPTLRQQINELYGQLTPGDSYTPNLEQLNASKGWFLRLPKGEKVLSSSVSFNGAVLFSTFSPRGSAVTTCGPDVGRGRFFALNLIDASAVFTKQVNGVATPTRSFDLGRSGIPPSPTVIVGDSGSDGSDNNTVCIGTECPKLECVEGGQFCNAPPISAKYWREN